MRSRDLPDIFFIRNELFLHAWVTCDTAYGFRNQHIFLFKLKEICNFSKFCLKTDLIGELVNKKNWAQLWLSPEYIYLSIFSKLQHEHRKNAIFHTFLDDFD